MLLLARMPVNVVISNACVAKIKYFLKNCPRQLWNLEKIKDILKYYSKKPLNRISLFIIFRVSSLASCIFLYYFYIYFLLYYIL
jgi:hypothetical protein